MTYFNICSFFLIALLMIISIIDIRCFQIPDALNALLAFGGFLASWISQGSFPWSAILDAIQYFLLFLAVQMIFKIATGRNGLGTGDVKFAGAAGFWIGTASIPPFLGIASLSALLHAASLLVLKPDSNVRIVAFGPFLSLALFMCWIMKNNLFLREYL